ncbi:hypothetical protein AB3N59_01325 [Leptospira sp. WS92.C1]
MELEFIKLILDHTNSVAVSHLKSFYRESDAPRFIRNASLDYHLHFLYYSYDENIGCVCLDTSQFIVCPESLYGEMTMRFLAANLTKALIDRISWLLKHQDQDSAVLFNKAPQDLWDRFNILKQNTFFDGIKGLANYLDTKSISSEPTELLIEENLYEDYKDFKFEIIEERIFKKSKTKIYQNH